MHILMHDNFKKTLRSYFFFTFFRNKTLSDESPLNYNSNINWIFIIYFTLLLTILIAIGIRLWILRKRQEKKGKSQIFVSFFF
mgnify:CR=1 FL=1